MNHRFSPPPAAHFEQLGKLAWLWMNSPLHRDWEVASFARFLLPAIELGQVELLERDGMPVAYCSWARMSPQAEMRYMLDASALQVDDWQSGERLWFIDWVAPFATRDSWRLRSRMSQRFPGEVARAIRVKRGSGSARVMHFKGSALASSAAKARIDGFYTEFFRELQRKSA